MTDLGKYVPPLVLQHLTADEKRYITEVFIRFDGYPALEQVWLLMDEQWIAHGCSGANGRAGDGLLSTSGLDAEWVVHRVACAEPGESAGVRRLGGAATPCAGG